MLNYLVYSHHLLYHIFCLWKNNICIQDLKNQGFLTSGYPLVPNLRTWISHLVTWRLPHAAGRKRRGRDLLRLRRHADGHAWGPRSAEDQTAGALRKSGDVGTTAEEVETRWGIFGDHLQEHRCLDYIIKLSEKIWWLDWERDCHGRI